MFEQFLLLLQALPDGDSKINLVSAFDKLKEDNLNTIATREQAKADNAPLKALIDDLKGVSGLNDLTADGLKTLLASKSKGGAEVDSLTATLTELRGKYGELETTHQDFVKGANKQAFDLALSQSEIFKDVSADPFLRNSVMNVISDKLMVGEDGSLVAKGGDGKVMNDLVSGKPITGVTLFNSMVESGVISKVALNSTIGNGTGGKQQQYHHQNQNVQTKSRGEFESMNSVQRSSFMKDGGKLTD